jgi:hypothetical protein
VNHAWECSEEFVLAEHYSRLLSTLALCSVLLAASPLSLLVLLVSLAVTFRTDYFLIARRHAVVKVFRSHLADSFIIGLLMVLCLHACISCRVVYSWPFDEAFVNAAGLVEGVDKSPPLLLCAQREAETHWHSAEQGRFLVAFQLLAWALALLVLGVAAVRVCGFWALKEWLRSRVHGARSEEEEVRRQSHAVPYSGVHGISAYCPVVRQGGGRELLLCCDVSNAMPRYVPETRCKLEHEHTNLTDDVRTHVCSAPCPALSCHPHGYRYLPPPPISLCFSICLCVCLSLPAGSLVRG